MIFNGDSDNQDLVSDIDYWCSTDSVTYPIADKVRNYAFGLAKTSSLIMRSDRRWKHVSSNLTSIPIAEYAFTAGQDNIPLETKHLKILRFRMSDRNGVMRTIEATDRSVEGNDILNESGDVESYDKIGPTIIPLPTPDYGGTAEIEYQPGAAVDLPTVNSTDWEVGFNQDFERLPGLYTSEDYCAIHNQERLPIIRAKIAEMEGALIDFYSNRDVDDEPAFKVKKIGSKGVSLLG